jgi:hypothetical protein
LRKWEAKNQSSVSRKTRILGCILVQQGEFFFEKKNQKTSLTLGHGL